MRAIKWVAVVIAAAIFFGAGATAAILHSVAPRTGLSDLAALFGRQSPPEAGVGWKIEHDQRVNLLLFAFGGSGGDDPNFTDTVIVLSIRPRPLEATVLSLPRHLRVDIPAPVNGTVSGLLYAAYSIGEAHDRQFLKAQWLTPTGPSDLLAATVSATIAQPIDGWVGLDQGAFAAIIDALGGVRVNVPVALDDWRYPLGVGTQTTHVHFDPGEQTMNGARALEYARSRRSTSEADRAARQEVVLVAMLQALRNFHPGVDTALALGPITAGLRTDLVPADVHRLADVADHLDPARVKRVSLEDSGLLETVVEGQIDTVVPVSGNYDDVRQWVASQLPS